MARSIVTAALSETPARYGAWSLLAVALLAACGKPPEGLNTGECQDLLDNDVDGLVDCFDPDCVNAGQCGDQVETACDDDLDNDVDGFVDCNDSDCAGASACGEDDVDDPPLVGNGEDCVGSSTPFVHNKLDGVTISYDVRFQLSGLTGALCGLDPAICDCSAHYEGAGTLVRAAENEALFVGTWAKISDTCVVVPGVGKMTDAIWANGEIETFHQFIWSGDGSRIDDWIAYRNEGDCDPMPPEQALSAGQFYVTQMAAPYNEAAQTALYDAVDNVNEGLIQIATSNVVDLSFD
jgi:hypothetical protein